MRSINSKFIDDLLHGELKYFLDRVKSERNIFSIEIREGYINIYYEGGSLLKIAQKKRNGYSFKFDAKYCKNKGNATKYDLLSSLDTDDVDSYKNHFDDFRVEMDTWFKVHKKPERDYQHQLLVNNSEIIDIEYQIKNKMRLDMLCFSEGKLYIIENKYGNGAIGGKSGMSEHYKDICNLLSGDEIKQEMLDSVCAISRCKKELGLTDFVIATEDIKGIEILFLMANYTPKGKALANEIDKMNASVPASILMTNDSDVKIDFNKARNIFSQE